MLFSGAFLILPVFLGHTIDRLRTLHELLTEAADWPRVVRCAQTVPVLLHIYFNTVVTVGTEHIPRKRRPNNIVVNLYFFFSLRWLMRSCWPIWFWWCWRGAASSSTSPHTAKRSTGTPEDILPRWRSESPSPNLPVLSAPRRLRRVFSCHLLRLCKLRPSLVVDQSHELLEFAGTTANVYSQEEVYTNVVMNVSLGCGVVSGITNRIWIQSGSPLSVLAWVNNMLIEEVVSGWQVWVLGEYLSLSSDSRCSVTLITSCFETLEAVLFEITSSAPPPGTECPAPRVITTLMSALAKLASRSHDLIPR